MSQICHVTYYPIINSQNFKNCSLTFFPAHCVFHDLGIGKMIGNTKERESLLLGYRGVRKDSSSSNKRKHGIFFFIFQQDTILSSQYYSSFQLVPNGSLCIPISFIPSQIEMKLVSSSSYQVLFLVFILLRKDKISTSCLFMLIPNRLYKVAKLLDDQSFNKVASPLIISLAYTLHDLLSCKAFANSCALGIQLGHCSS